jgi:hypothetical protein
VIVGQLVIVCLVLVLAIQVVRSPLGFVIAAALVIFAIGYGRVNARSQGERERLWRNLSSLRLLDGVEFESHVAETYRKKGYHVTLTRASGDQGVDVIANKDTERIAVRKRSEGGVGKIFGCIEQGYHPVLSARRDFALPAPREHWQAAQRYVEYQVRQHGRGRLGGGHLPRAWKARP